MSFGFHFSTVETAVDRPVFPESCFSDGFVHWLFDDGSATSLICDLMGRYYISYHIISYRIVSYRIISYHIYVIFQLPCFENTLFPRFHNTLKKTLVVIYLVPDNVSITSPRASLRSLSRCLLDLRVRPCDSTFPG